MTALTHEFSATLHAPPERVFRAFTDEAELSAWFAEHVEVEPQVGGEYRFWGIHTHGAPTRAQAAHKVIRIEAPRLLAFSWRLEGCDSEVTLEFTAGKSDKGEPTTELPVTHLKGRQHFPDAPEVPRALDLVDDLWRMNLSNLQAHLAGSPVLRREDFSDPMPRIRQAVLINAPRDKVYQSFFDTPFLDAWLGGKAVVEPKVEGRYSYGWKYDVRGKQVEGGPTKILEMVEDTKLVTDWPNWRGDLQMPAQRVSWVLESVSEQTRVILIHEPFERTADLSDYPQGWAYFLAVLKSKLEAA